MGVFVFPTSATSNANDAAYQSYMVSAAALEGRPDIGPATKLYERAADVAPSNAKRAEAWLGWAGLLSRRPGQGQEAERRKKQAEDLYHLALAGAEGELGLRARNDYGVFLFRSGRAAEATEVFGKVAPGPWLGPDGAARRARFLYNYGQVLEHVGRTQDAIPLYLKAMQLDIRFAPAREAAKRLAEEPAGAKLPAETDPALPLAQELLDQKRFPEAEALLVQLADDPNRLRSDSGKFADLFLRYLVEAQIDPPRFTHVWDQPSQRLQKALAPPMSERIGEIRSAYLANLPTDWQPYAAASLFPSWSDTDRVGPFSDLLKRIGDAFAEEGDPHRALERYAQATSLNPADHGGDLYLASLLVEHRQRLDPQGELLARFVHERGAQPENLREPKDLEQLVFLHSLLAADARDHQRWGPEDDPQTAIYQWQQALEANSKLVAVAPEQAHQRPALYEQLALAYEGLGDPEKAAAYRVAARIDDPSRVNLQARTAFEEPGGVISLDHHWDTSTSYRNQWSQNSMSRKSSAQRIGYTTGTAGTGPQSFPTTANTTGTTTIASTEVTSTHWHVESSDSIAVSGSLPATASPWPAMGLTGLLSLGAVLAIRRIRLLRREQ
jgi:tetratricopeptide (TPR) repeat protein